jgi:hypothetical protein
MDRAGVELDGEKRPIIADPGAGMIHRRVEHGDSFNKWLNVADSSNPPTVASPAMKVVKKS